MNTEGILSQAKKHQDFIQQLKEHSPYYPDYVTGLNFGNTYISTIVRIEREGKWYRVHCVESMHGFATLPALYPKFMKTVYKIQHLWQLTGKYEELDSLQITEVQRLTGTR
jgi:hypothetical protein